MANRVYKVTQIVGTSDKSFEDAVKTAVKRASKTLDDLAWFEVVEQRGKIGDGGSLEYQVKLDIGFKLK